MKRKIPKIATIASILFTAFDYTTAKAEDIAVDLSSRHDIRHDEIPAVNYHDDNQTIEISFPQNEGMATITITDTLDRTSQRMIHNTTSPSTSYIITNTHDPYIITITTSIGNKYKGILVL